MTVHRRLYLCKMIRLQNDCRKFYLKKNNLIQNDVVQNDYRHCKMIVVLVTNENKTYCLKSKWLYKNEFICTKCEKQTDLRQNDFS